MDENTQPTADTTEPVAPVESGVDPVVEQPEAENTTEPVAEETTV